MNKLTTLADNRQNVLNSDGGLESAGERTQASADLTDFVQPEMPSESEKAKSTVLSLVTEPGASSNELKAQPPAPMISQLEWNSLIRNARDGGANSVLASKVLEKTSTLIKVSDGKVDEMIKSAGQMRIDIGNLRQISDVIKEISLQAKIVAFNATLEAGRAGENGRVFAVVAAEISDLSSRVKALTTDIEARLGYLTQAVIKNETHCILVADLSGKTANELNQFTFLMMRLQELSTTQVQSLSSVEKALDQKLAMGS